MMSEAAARALGILRDGSQFSWYVIPLFAFVVYVYAVEIERRNWSLIFAGLAYWGMDRFKLLATDRRGSLGAFCKEISDFQLSLTHDLWSLTSL